MVPDAALVDRFRADLDSLTDPGAKLGLAVSGGPDSLAMLLLAAAARPGGVEAATVDHGLRPESRSEAEAVASLCETLGVPHATLAIEWDLPPTSAIQEQARSVRYGALATWLRDRELGPLLTAHHLDDQAETMLMRLNRGSGVRGLAGMRRQSPLPGDPDQLVLRPLLAWRRSELEEICAMAGVSPAADPSNEDGKFERVRIRRGLAGADWLDQQGIARSAGHCADADEAVDWAAGIEWSRSASARDGEIIYRPSCAPAEIVRRIVARAIEELGTEGEPDDLRGRELDRLISDLEAGKTASLRGVRCSGGPEWHFTRAAKRRGARASATLD
jgi:tRNA(Ile)-lysidine synthase